MTWLLLFLSGLLIGGLVGGVLGFLYAVGLAEEYVAERKRKTNATRGAISDKYLRGVE